MRELLINADDFGISLPVNRAISYCFQNKLIQRTTLMVNMPYTEDAVEIAYCKGFEEKVGLHLNLFEGIPLTDAIRHTIFCADNGNFKGIVFRSIKDKLLLSQRVKKAISEEMEAQILKYKQYGFSLMHIDSHHHFHTIPSIFFELYPLLCKYEFKTIRLSRNIPHSEIKGFKRLYKDVLNKKILSFNESTQRATQACVTKFGSQNDVEKEFLQNKKVKGLIEMEIHPSLSGGVLIDLYNPTNIAEWLKRYNIS